VLRIFNHRQETIQSLFRNQTIPSATNSA
jgi:hypothetical protein